ncbi:MAG TPA: cytochrome c [Micromonosporaceae bacterium]|nr:cytochrome c [Micromonosporaceae bacterium]
MTADRTGGDTGGGDTTGAGTGGTPADRGAPSAAGTRLPPAELTRAGARAGRSRLRRRLAATVRLVAALTIMGGLYTAFAPGSAAEDTPQMSDQAAAGKALYDISCITCHGSNGQGETDRGPSLIGVGAASVHFQVSSGRMPMARQEAQSQRKEPQFNEEQTRQLAAYIQALGGGPQIPDKEAVDPSGGDLAKGGELFRVNCSACHAFSAGGGALSAGKFAPTLRPATTTQIYEAMLTGPQNMPVFGDNQLTPEEKRDVIAYVQNLNDQKDPGGFSLGRYGPTPEGLVTFVVGMAALVLATLWIAGKS